MTDETTDGAEGADDEVSMLYLSPEMDARFAVDHDDTEPFRKKVTYELGGYLYEMPVEPKCKTCRSPYRPQVESALIRGFSYAEIERGLPDDALLSWRNISDHHANGHMPLRERAKRVLIEQRAEELNLDIENAEAQIIDHLTLGRATINRVFERMSSGEIEPEISDAIQFSRLILQMEELAAADGGGSLDSSVLRDLLMVYSQVLNEHCDAATLERVHEDLFNHPVVIAIRGESQQGQIGR